uniref:Condensin complex subunit 1 n=2 Tax=Bursaphelenchus xylophilus TaxID=6326 RepID=A0A1I7SDZ0_BURXY
MALLNAVNAIVDHLGGVNELDAEACKEVRKAHYGVYGQLSDTLRCELFDVSPQELTEALNTVTERILRFATAQNGDENNFYEALMNEGIDLIKMTVFLWVLIERSLTSNEELELGVAASNLYLCFAGLKDAKMYKVFHVYVFERALELLRNVEKIIRPSGRMTIALNKRRRDDQNAVDPGIDCGKMADKLLESLRILFLFTHSKGVADIVFEKEGLCESVIDFLRDISDLDLDSNTDFQAKIIDEISRVRRASDLAFAIVQALLQKDSDSRSMAIMSRFVMPRILYWVGGNSKYHITGAIPNVLKEACQVMIHFLSTRFDNLTLSELRSIMQMLKICPLRCTDRSEHRSLLAQNFSEILAMMPPIAAVHMIDYVYILGRNTKTSYRSFALEIVPNLLRRFNFDQLHDRAERIETMFMGDVDEQIDGQEADDEIVEGNAAEEPEEPAEQEAMEIVEDENEGEVTIRDEEDEAAAENAPRNGRNANSEGLCVFEKEGMTARQAILNLLITGLVDKFAMQKALQAVEMLVTSNACVDDLAVLATRLVDENLEALKLADRPARAQQQEAPVVKEEPQEHELSAILEDQPNSAGIDDLLRLVIKACDSEKTPIAKHALCCLQAILINVEVDPEMTKKCVEKIKEKCWDVAIQVRKQAALCLHKLLPRFPSGIEHAWLRGVLHQVVDNESGVANQAIKLASEYIVDGLKEERPNPTWNLMDVVEGDTEYT